MNIHIFGGSNPSGKSFLNLLSSKSPSSRIFAFSRKSKFNYVDLDDASTYEPKKNEEYVLISFAPIWKISNFLEQLYSKDISKFSFIKGLIICSSSSVITKRFTSNKFDKDLYYKLKNSEDKIFDLSKKSKKPLFIIRPTLIYGNVGEFKDRNINLIISIMRKIPFVLIPSSSGMRQPIHAIQLAEFILVKCQLVWESNFQRREKILLGGDYIFSFKSMLMKIKKALPDNDKAKRCKIITINRRLFLFLISPLCLISPKLFESLLRINIDLSGFEKVSKLLKKEPFEFPAGGKNYFD